MAITTRQVIQATLAIKNLNHQNAQDILCNLLETNPDLIYNTLIPSFEGVTVSVKCASVECNLKIHAIKCWRELTGYGLVEAKAFVEGSGSYTTSKYKDFYDAMKKCGAILEIVK